EIEPRRLPDRHDDGVAFDLGLAVIVESRIEAFVLIEDPSGLEGLKSGNLAIFAENALGSEPGMHDDSFFFGFDNFFECRGHLIPTFQTDQVYFTCAHAQCRKRDVYHFLRRDRRNILSRRLEIHDPSCMLTHHFAGSGAGDIHGDISAADHNHLLADGELVSEIYVQQEIYAFVDAIEIDARNAEIAAAMGAHCDQHGG